MEFTIDTEESLPSVASLPRTAQLLQDGSALVLKYADGRTRYLAAGRLRGACRCSSCRRSEIDGNGVMSPAELHIVRIDDMGGRALNVVFSDGHDRGLFPWNYLQSLSEPNPNEAAS